jgi:hypothetical protein
MKRVLVAVLLALPTGAVALVAPEEAACTGRRVGAACEAAGRSGRCQTGECCHNDYATGGLPEEVCEPCLICQQGPVGDRRDGEQTDTERGCATAPGTSSGWGWALGLLLAIRGASGASRRSSRGRPAGA